MAFQKATKKQAKGRLALVGPSGSGKTFSALRIASALGKRVAVIDSERGSASKYADKFEFDVCELSSFSPLEYVKAISDAEAAGYDVLVIDSLSHAWEGKGGALEMVDDAAARSRSANKFTAWRDVTPIHNKLVGAIVSSSCHVIVTMRAKTEYILEEDERGKKVPKKIGMAPIQRAGVEYEFDVVCDLDHELRCIVSKSRCSDLTQKVFKPATESDLGAIFAGWLGSGDAAAARKEIKAVEPAEAVAVEEPESSESKTLTKDDRLRVNECIAIRLGELELDPKVYASICAADILRMAGYKKSADVPRSLLGDVMAAVGAWEPKDSAPDFGGEAS